MKDKIKIGEDKVAFCPTADMLGDLFTKPIQGALFFHMREKVPYLYVSTSTQVHMSVLEDQTNKVRLTKQESSRVLKVLHKSLQEP